MKPSAKSKIRALLLAFFSALVPGVYEIRNGFKLLGWLTVGIQFIVASAAAFIAYIYATDQVRFFTLATSDTVLMVVQTSCLVLTAVYILAAASTLSRIRRNKSKFGNSHIAISLFLISSLGFQSIISYTAAGYVQSTRDLLNDVFAIPESDSAQAATAPRLNIMLLGGDAGIGRVGLRTDSISVLSVNKVSGKTTIIGIPRNMQGVKFNPSSPLYKKFPKGYRCPKNQCLLEYVYNYGMGHKSLYSAAKYGGKSAGVLAMRDALEGLLGIKINNYVLIDMTGFLKVIDAVGGVEVCVPKTIVAQDGKTLFQKGCQKMSGGSALLYSRTRYDSNDYNRMRKQRLVQVALIKQIAPLELIKAFLDVSSAHRGYIKTDFLREDAGWLIPLAEQANKLAVGTLELSPPKYSMTQPNLAKIRTDVANTLRRN